jgi:DNA-binding response OmpR family regulator
MNDQKKRLLIVDDEEGILKALDRALSMVGYDVTTANDGTKALNLLSYSRFDLMVLDLQMPGVHGIEVMRRAREMDRQLLIVVLTGTATLESAIEAVRSHAVNFLLKPVGITEVVTTVEESLRHHSDDQHRKRVMDVLMRLTEPLRYPGIENGAMPHEEQSKPIRLDEANRVVYLGERNEPIPLTEGEAAILRVFLDTPRQVMACRDLARLAWDYDLEEIEAQTLIRPYIFRLRQKLESDPNQPNRIRTVRGRGYLWGD